MGRKYRLTVDSDYFAEKEHRVTDNQHIRAPYGLELPSETVTLAKIEEIK